MSADPLRAARAAIEELRPPPRVGALVVAGKGFAAWRAERRAEALDEEGEDGASAALLIRSTGGSRIEVSRPAGGAPASLSFRLEFRGFATRGGLSARAGAEPGGDFRRADDA